MHLGVTGTRKGLSEKQFNLVKEFVKENTSIISHFHHGDCIGVDVQIATLVEHYLPKVWIVSHPSRGVKTRAHGPAHEIMRPKDYIVRDQDIVDNSEYLWACPDGKERIRSGTWTTVRMARKKGLSITIIMPDGEVIYE